MSKLLFARAAAEVAALVLLPLLVTTRRAIFLSSVRLLHLGPSLLTVLAAGAFILLAAHTFPPVTILLPLLAIEAAMQFSISAFNDYFDRHVDAGRADKPLVTGAISPRAAATTGAVLALLAIALSLPFGFWLMLLTIAGLGGGLLYDVGLKYTLFSWLPFSLAFPTLPVWAWVGVHPNGPFPLQLLWVVPVGGALAFSIHLSDTLPDLASDSRAGVRGLAHRLGVGRSVAMCWGAFYLALLMTLALSLFLRYNPPWYVGGLLASIALMAGGIAVYRADSFRLKEMALLVQLACLALAVGWIGAILSL